MQLVYLAEILDANEQDCAHRLGIIQRTDRERLTLADKQWLAFAEARLVNELNRVRHVRLTTRVRDAIVVITAGGVA